jgi:hypothetical protein
MNDLSQWLRPSPNVHIGMRLLVLQPCIPVLTPSQTKAPAPWSIEFNSTSQRMQGICFRAEFVLSSKPLPLHLQIKMPRLRYILPVYGDQSKTRSRVTHWRFAIRGQWGRQT